MNTITIKEINDSTVNTFSVKSDSVRGFETVWKNEVKVGDEVIINNHFTLVID